MTEATAMRDTYALFSYLVLLLGLLLLASLVAGRNRVLLPYCGERILRTHTRETVLW